MHTLVLVVSDICTMCSFVACLSRICVTLSVVLTGPLNSWDRQPFLTTVAHGYPSMDMAWRKIPQQLFHRQLLPASESDVFCATGYHLYISVCVCACLVVAYVCLRGVCNRCLMVVRAS